MVRGWYRGLHDKWNSIIKPIDQISPRSPAGGRILTYTAKDNILTKGTTTCGSRILAKFASPYNATVIDLFNAKMALIGKANLDEFGMGSSTTNSMFGPTYNPLYPAKDYIVGGSSGGSAASVAAKLCDFSIGTDTGGSIRLPASNCGLYGFKPSYGRISRWGVIAYAQTLDTVGIVARDVDVIKMVFNLLDKHDDKDPTCLGDDIRQEISHSADLRTQTRDGKFVFGVPQELIVEELTGNAKEKLTKAAETLLDQGHTVNLVSIPSIKRSLLAYYSIATAEATSNLSRYDGIRYGDANGDIAMARTEGFGSEVQRRIILGNYTISSTSGDHYAKANELRKALVDEFNDIFYLPNHLVEASKPSDLAKCDFLLSCTTISKPITVQEFIRNEQNNLLQAYTNDILTVPMSLAGLPTLTIPFGENSVQGLQIFGQYGDDQGVLNVAGYL